MDVGHWPGSMNEALIAGIDPYKHITPTSVVSMHDLDAETKGRHR